MSRGVRGRPASVGVRLPVWKAESIATDIANLLSLVQRTPRDQQPLYPLALHDFAEELKAAIKETEGG